MATYILGNAGLKVCLLEPVPCMIPKKILLNLNGIGNPQCRGASTAYRNNGDMDACYGGWELEGEPYTQVNKPGSKFDWFRGRMLGGRTNHWGRISLRFGLWFFKTQEPWWIGWRLAHQLWRGKTLYDRVDQLLGVFGTNEGLPNDPDGFFLPPPKPRLHELYIKKKKKKKKNGAIKPGVPVIPSRLFYVDKKSMMTGVCLCFLWAMQPRMSVLCDFSSSSCLVIPALKQECRINL